MKVFEKEKADISARGLASHRYSILQTLRNKPIKWKVINNSK